MKDYKIIKSGSGDERSYIAVVTQSSDINCGGDVLFSRQYQTLAGAEKALAREKSK